MMDQNMPTWAVPHRRDASSSLPQAIPGAKYHCFENGRSMCGKYLSPITADYIIESGEILSRPEIACVVCRKRWMRSFDI